MVTTSGQWGKRISLADTHTVGSGRFITHQQCHWFGGQVPTIVFWTDWTNCFERRPMHEDRWPLVESKKNSLVTLESVIFLSRCSLSRWNCKCSCRSNSGCQKEQTNWSPNLSEFRETTYCFSTVPRTHGTYTRMHLCNIQRTAGACGVLNIYWDKEHEWWMQLEIHVFFLTGAASVW